MSNQYKCFERKSVFIVVVSIFLISAGTSGSRQPNTTPPCASIYIHVVNLKAVPSSIPEDADEKTCDAVVSII
uniref:Putative secreted protein n=1 Tax=Anopheles darlingi TaxID=43151 RepID=A0A2M4DEG5_ANODA